MDKVWDEDYYILTLAALAKELKGRGLCNASVILAAGLLIKWLGGQGEAFRKYLLKNKEVTFRCNDTRYHSNAKGYKYRLSRNKAVPAGII